MSNRLQARTISPTKANSRSGAVQSTTEAPSSGDSTRNEALLRELQQLQLINGVVSNLNKMIQHTKANMTQLNESTGITQHLLDKWIRILNQATYNQELIDDINKQSLVDEDNGVEEDLKSSDDIEADLHDKLEREQVLIEQLEALEQANLEMEQQLAAKDKRDKEILEQKQSQDYNRKRQLGLTSLKNDKKRVAR